MKKITWTRVWCFTLFVFGTHSVTAQNEAVIELRVQKADGTPVADTGIIIGYYNKVTSRRSGDDGVCDYTVEIVPGEDAFVTITPFGVGYNPSVVMEEDATAYLADAARRMLTSEAPLKATVVIPATLIETGFVSHVIVVGPSGNLRGTILDTAGQPVSALIYTDQQYMVGMTDGNGEFAVTGVPEVSEVVIGIDLDEAVYLLDTAMEYPGPDTDIGVLQVPDLSGTVEIQGTLVYRIKSKVAGDINEHRICLLKEDGTVFYRVGIEPVGEPVDGDAYEMIEPTSGNVCKVPLGTYYVVLGGIAYDRFLWEYRSFILNAPQSDPRRDSLIRLVVPPGVTQVQIDYDETDLLASMP